MILDIIISLLVLIISRRLGLSEGNAAKLSFYTFIVLWMDFGLEGWVAGLIAYACYRFFRAAWESDGITH